jgi:predicted O-linked N-acetylglucosamine transferase (SPINDLY family)
VLQRTDELIKEAAERETAGDLAAAYALCTQVLAEGGGHAATSERAARLAERLGRRAEAIQHFRAAIAAAPRRSELRVSLVRLLIETGDPKSAAAEAEALVKTEPKDWRAPNMLGVALRRLGRQADAIAHFEKAAKLNRKAESPWINLGNARRDLRQPDKAAEAYRRALQLAPKNADTVRLLGTALCEAGKTDEGLATLGRAIMLDAGNAEAFHDRAVALYNASRPQEAMRDVERALSLQPARVAYLRLRGAVERRLGRLQDSRKTYEQILNAHPDDAHTLQLYASLCAMSLGDYRTANDALTKARSLRPDDVRLAAQHCRVLMESRYDVEGKFIDAAHAIAAPLVDAATPPVDCVDDLQGVFLRTADFARGARLGPRDRLFEHWIRTNNIGALHNQLGRVRTMEDRHALVEHHRAWGRLLSARSRPLPPRPRRPLAGRKLRIGLMSSDLRNHPVSYFALPIIDHYDRDRCEIYCYSFYPQPPDNVQAFIAKNVAEFRLMPDLDNSAAAERIAADDLDILFELGGSTRYNRLELTALRPAPIQVSWLGYPHSSGVAEIDYVLVDPYLNPEDPTLLIERPFLMPESWVCLGRLGFHDGIAIEPGLPEERERKLTFGTANNPYKLTAELIELWAKVMAAVPDSRFLFIRPEGGSAAFRTNIGQAFESHGIAAARIFYAPVRGTHLPYYNKIDIALDTSPHTGGTTTCESLWMGVPTVTLIGPSFFERLSYSNLSNAGLGDLCARTPEDYVDIALRLAADRERRRTLRHGLRAQIRAHPLGQADRWVRNFIGVAERTVAAGAAVSRKR